MRRFVVLLLAGSALLTGGCFFDTDDPDAGPGNGWLEQAGAGNSALSNATVGDVAAQVSGGTPGRPVPGVGSFSARVDNESLLKADVTLEFFQIRTLVHRTVLRDIPSGASVPLAGPEAASLLVVTGTRSTGEALPERHFVFDVDVPEHGLAVYVIPPLEDADEGEPGQPDGPAQPEEDAGTNGEADVDTNGFDDADTSGVEEEEEEAEDNDHGAPPPPPDCNTNGVDDALDITYGTARDCNGNDVPDVCDIAAHTSDDCNTSRVPDECDISAGSSEDVDSNGVPDECDCPTFEWIAPGDIPNLIGCMTGPGGPPLDVDAGCHCFDFDGDGDVDLRDVAAFQRLSAAPPSGLPDFDPAQPCDSGAPPGHSTPCRARLIGTRYRHIARRRPWVQHLPMTAPIPCAAACAPPGRLPESCKLRQGA